MYSSDILAKCHLAKWRLAVSRSTDATCLNKTDERNGLFCFPSLSFRTVLRCIYTCDFRVRFGSLRNRSLFTVSDLVFPHRQTRLKFCGFVRNRYLKVKIYCMVWKKIWMRLKNKLSNLISANTQHFYHEPHLIKLVP